MTIFYPWMNAIDRSPFACPVWTETCALNKHFPLDRKVLDQSIAGIWISLRGLICGHEDWRMLGRRDTRRHNIPQPQSQSYLQIQLGKGSAHNREVSLLSFTNSIFRYLTPFHQLTTKMAMLLSFKGFFLS